MKKFLLFVSVITVGALTSCTKPYSCSCTTVCKTSNSGCVNKTEDTAPTRNTKKSAKIMCDSASNETTDQKTTCVVK